MFLHEFFIMQVLCGVIFVADLAAMKVMFKKVFVQCVLLILGYM
jgi:hypothetical protein